MILCKGNQRGQAEEESWGLENLMWANDQYQSRGQG